MPSLQVSRGKEEEEEVEEEEEELERRNSFPDLDDDDFLPPIDPQRLTFFRNDFDPFH